MEKIHSFPCPNCGENGTRRYFISQDSIYNKCLGRQIVTTECSSCDYLMTVCSLDGKVIETSSTPFIMFTISSKIKTAIEQNLAA